jgi:hypothetical protein
VCGPISVTYLGAMVIPLWSVFLLTAGMPSWVLLVARSRWRREKRRKLGLCEHCGYDLRATPERCPECGHAGILQVKGFVFRSVMF